MKPRLVILSLLLVLLYGPPSQAETPTEVIDEMRATNVQRLILTNRCRRCDLVGTDLSKTHLIGADLRGAILTGANLSWSNLEGADFTGAHLTGANFTGAFLTNASLVNTTLDHANFSQAQIYYADVTGASMENLNLADATVVGTPISIGGASPEDSELPMLAPDDGWQFMPPVHSPSDFRHVPGETLEEILDIPPQVIPQV